MSGAKVVIDSKFPDASFREIWGPHGLKIISTTTPPAKTYTSFFRTKIFSAP